MTPHRSHDMRATRGKQERAERYTHATKSRGGSHAILPPATEESTMGRSEVVGEGVGLSATW